ncbi:MAG: PAS domain-containing protein, partial [Thermoleophilia bacterium]
AADGHVPLGTGGLSLEELGLVLSALPVDFQYVDEHDKVRFYSEGERIFPRSPGVIGRKVQNCHPPSSVHKVQQIIDAFRAGEQSTAEFWIELGGKFLHIRYFALRDAAGAYRGVVETVQDVTGIRALEGQRRLLDW